MIKLSQHISLVCLVLLLALIVLAFLRRKRTISGTIVGKRIAMDSSGNSTVTIKSFDGKRWNLVFDTYARIGCRHFKLSGTSQCWHKVDPKEFDKQMEYNKTITVEIDSVGDEPNILFVHRVVKIT